MIPCLPLESLECNFSNNSPTISSYTSQTLLKPDIAGIPSMPEHWVGLHWIVHGKPAPATELYCMASASCLRYLLRHVLLNNHCMYMCGALLCRGNAYRVSICIVTICGVLHTFKFIPPPHTASSNIHAYVFVYISKCASWYRQKPTSASCRWCPPWVQADHLD